jgi:hypothetical protein
VITEPTDADKYLPPESGFLFVKTLEEAVEAVDGVRNDWRRHSKAARDCAIECFDSVKNLKMILS